jgi:hypothetical protein
MDSRMPTPLRILYCHCAYAQVVPKAVKEEVLRRLADSGVAFDAVADLCEMSARHDPALHRLAQEGCVRIAACYPRAVKWLFSAAGAPLPAEGVEILNMRTQTAEEIVAALMPAAAVDGPGDDKLEARSSNLESASKLDVRNSFEIRDSNFELPEGT